LKYFVIITIVIVTIIGVFLLVKRAPVSVSENSQKMTDTSPLPFPIVDKTKKYSAVISTSVGDVTVSLNVEKTPITVSNFVSLANKGFYNGTVFHRVIKGFMIQGGDPNGDGTGGPGYKFNDEPITDDYKRGTIAMANSGPNTNGSQFFIMHADYPLPKNYVIFGNVTNGIDVVDKIATAPVKSNPASGEDSTPITPVQVKSVKIIVE
jgi:cyclophilin family peptidyl-prolyl cis-trans isomerase